jgi:DNA-binding LacI/PurR family transcriptional regulator
VTSVRKIAKKAGVSVATVSRTLNNVPMVGAATRERVLAAAESFGYVPPPSRRSNAAIGLAYPGEPVLPCQGDFETALISGLLRGLSEQRQDLRIVSIGRDKAPNETYSQFFARKGIKGVVMRTFANSRGICEAVAAEGFPSIVVADRFEDPRVSFVCTDSKDDSRRALQHLVNLGHRRIAIAVHCVEDTDHRDRRNAYVETLQSCGIDVDPSLVFEIYATMEGGASVVTQLLSMSLPATALFFTDPLSSVGALRRCHELGVRVPGELSIIGFDDSQIRRQLYPTMTAVCQDAEVLGYEAARWIVPASAGSSSGGVGTSNQSSGHMSIGTSSGPSGIAPPPLRRVFPTMFEVNNTTAPPPDRVVRVMPDGTRWGEHDAAVVTMKGSGKRRSRLVG